MKKERERARLCACEREWLLRHTCALRVKGRRIQTLAWTCFGLLVVSKEHTFFLNGLFYYVCNCLYYVQTDLCSAVTVECVKEEAGVIVDISYCFLLKSNVDDC